MNSRSLTNDALIGTEISVSADDLNSTREAARFGQRVGQLIEQKSGSSQPWIRLDFGNVDHISSAGLNELIAINRRARGNGQQIVLVDVPEMVLEVFVLTRVERMFEFASKTAMDTSNDPLPM